MDEKTSDESDTIADPFVDKLHLIRDITHSRLESLVHACRQSYGDAILRSLLIDYCMRDLSSVTDIKQHPSSAKLRSVLVTYGEKFNPLNPALLNILPKSVLSKCFSYLDTYSLLSGVELTCRDWFHVARLPSSTAELPLTDQTFNSTPMDAAVSLPSYPDSPHIARFRSASVLRFTHSLSIDCVQSLFPESESVVSSMLSHVSHIKIYSINGLQYFFTDCGDEFKLQIEKLTINYGNYEIPIVLFNSVTDRLFNLHTLELRSIIVGKKLYTSIQSFVAETCPQLHVFVARKWKFTGDKINITAILKILAKHCPQLTELHIAHLRIDDDAMVPITQLFDQSLESLAIIQCNRLKMNSYKELGRKQMQLTSSGKGLKEFVIDEKMISANIFDNLCGIQSLSIYADFLRNGIKWQSVNRMQSLREVTLCFRSAVDRAEMHSPLQFDWSLFFRALGPSLEVLQCDCETQKNRKTDDNDLEAFMNITPSFFKYVVNYCKKLRVLSMSGWKFSREESKSSPVADDAKSNESGGGHSPMVSHKKSASSKDGSRKKPNAYRSMSVTNIRGGVPNIMRQPSMLMESAFESTLMTPLATLFDPDESPSDLKDGRDCGLDAMHLLWLFESNDAVTLDMLHTWSDLILGLKFVMSLSAQKQSVVLVQWNANWTQHEIEPEIVHAQYGELSDTTELNRARHRRFGSATSMASVPTILTSRPRSTSSTATGGGSTREAGSSPKTFGFSPKAPPKPLPSGRAKLEAVINRPARAKTATSSVNPYAPRNLHSGNASVLGTLNQKKNPKKLKSQMKNMKRKSIEFQRKKGGGSVSDLSVVRSKTNRLKNRTLNKNPKPKIGNSKSNDNKPPQNKKKKSIPLPS